jgi:hypothetical protein
MRASFIILFILIFPLFSGAQVQEDIVIETEIDESDISGQEDFEQFVQQTMLDLPTTFSPVLNRFKKVKNKDDKITYNYRLDWNYPKEEIFPTTMQKIIIPEDILIEAKAQNPIKPVLPGLKIDNVFSISVYSDNFAKAPTSYHLKEQKMKRNPEDYGSGRIQFFFDLTRAIKSKGYAKIILTAGLFSRFAQVSGLNNKEHFHPTIKLQTPMQNQINFGVSIRFDSKKKHKKLHLLEGTL